MVTFNFIVMNALKNSVRLVGHLGKDPEFHNYGSGKDCARVSIATNERFKNQSGDWEADTQWHRLVFWGKLAEVARDHLSTGTQVMVEGKLINRTYEDEKDQVRYITEIRVGQLLILSSKAEEVVGFDEEVPMSP